MEVIGIKSCCYRIITRPSGVTHDDAHQLSQACYPVSLSSPTVIPQYLEFLAIYCDYDTKLINQTLKHEKRLITKLVDTHAFVPIKAAVENKIDKIMDQVTTSNSVNVVILGFDSLSHMNFLRSMPKSYAFLMETLDAVEMQGYNSVSSNTYSNMMVALTSHNVKEIEHICNIKRSYNSCPFIWKKFARQGFRTMYGEDAVNNRSNGLSDGIFNYMLTGFETPPTDYYLRPYGMLSDRLRYAYEDVCYGPRHTLEVLLDYTQKLAHSMGKNKRYFQFLWSTTIAHGGLNDGKLGDKHLLRALEWFHQEGYFNQTLLILLSDHGLRWGPIMDTMQGTLELRMPFVYFIIPTWFKESYAVAYQNLKTNFDKFTTPYDFHETLADLVNLESVTNYEIRAREVKLLRRPMTLPRGISLFLPIPITRTCPMAGIEDHYCVCRNLKGMPINHPGVRRSAGYAIRYINSILMNYPQCEILTLGSIQRAKAGKSLMKEDVFQIFFTTIPNNASFEATVIRSNAGQWNISGTIDRTNLYKDQSHCVYEREAKLYCYCTDLI
ncbi:unnamed protein product [Orchesella dallaii]|uniref:Uncharacterized protein n=1 Tax=Orchesella dallaii TaxID=48710 RepID=A0ABP1PJ91_9HEXA